MATSFKMNPDLEKERKGASFDSESLTHLLNGGVQQTRRKRYLENLIINDAAFDGPDYYFLSDTEAYSDGLRRELLLVNKLRSLNITDDADIATMLGVAFASSTGLSIHRLAFLPALHSLSTDEQRAKWMPLARNYEILGSYSQTELGHGSHLRGLETTAVYDSSTQEFVLNTPTLTSMKWWPGNLARTTNFTLVMAQLHSGGVAHGIHPFLLQIRCRDTHKVMPGVTLGDIGPTLEFKANDNGYMILKDVRIPRLHMLMRNGQILADGTYVKPANEKLVYASMLNIRAGLPSGTAALLAKAVTIAIRYSCVRRQSELQPNGAEPQVLDFQTQQDKLFGPLAMAYAFWFSGQRITAMYGRLLDELATGDTQALAQMHALSAGMKSRTTLTASEAVAACRLACGGHGFSHASGLPKLYGMLAATAHAEGDGTVLYLQLSRYLLKCLLDVQKGRPVKNAFADYIGQRLRSDAPFLGDGSLTSLTDALGYRAFTLLRAAAEQLVRLMADGKKEHEAFNLISVQLVDVAKAHCDYFILKSFVKRVAETVDGPVHAALQTLCALYGIHTVLQATGVFLQDGYMQSADVLTLQQTHVALLSAVRRDAVALVDAFDFPDVALHSVLGRYDGDVYANLYKWTAEAPLNQTEIHDSYEKYLRPMMKVAKSKL